MGMRDMQTDTCHGACGAGCPDCAKTFQINLGPHPVIAEDAKLAGVDGGSPLVRNRMP